ncbi:MAG: bifunctional glutamate N-acetyltransferase/amino-acid acetyltransferase ArgJ [Desulfuromonadales bacterium]|nr:bifunctional glutamate N-acetyltransferase/amino-acid acetyltransferase ArgJ [Desulfuromonadales bacterium]
MPNSNVTDLPAGFRYAARAAGIKKSGKPDLAMIVADRPAVCAGTFTTNRVVAAPVVLTRERIRSGLCQAILVNSGNANACTGKQGLADARRCAVLTAGALGIAEELVAVCSTGVIGVTLPMTCFETHVPELAKELSVDQVHAVAEAMRTTDAFPKIAARSVVIGGRDCRIVGLAKGAGMIHPNMATMLAFVMTDAAVDGSVAGALLSTAVERTFNRITVDRDTSTNDTVLLLASGAAGAPALVPDSPEGLSFAAALEAVLQDLAKMIVRDGEGATKLVRIQVDGAASETDALTVARSIATSALVKTAFFGADANWGRIIAAAGYAGVEIDPDRIRILFDDVPMVEKGLGLGAQQETRATEVLKKAEFTVTVELGLGSGSAWYHTSDLGYEYVRINADYRS